MLPLFCILLVILPPVSSRTAPADTVYSIPEVTVTATRLERSTFEATAHIDVIDGDDARASGARHLADVLQQHSGVFLRRYGSGGLASVSLRGTGASQTAILLDGRRLTDPQVGQLDLSLLPASIVDRVEVMNGAASPFYGAEGIGGAVHLRTQQPGAGSNARFHAAGGSFGMREASVGIGAGRGAFSLALSADAEIARNDYAYFSRPLQRDVRLENADRRRSSFYGTARYERPRHQVSLSVLDVKAERGLAGSAAATRGERQWDDATRIWGDVRIGGSMRGMKIGGMVQRSAVRYLNDRLDLDQRGRNTVASIDAEITTSLPGTWMAIAGTELGMATAHHPQLDRIREHRGAVFLQTAGELGPVLVNAAVRGDAYLEPDADHPSVRYATVNPRIGISLPLSSAVRFRASVARGFRAPTFNDRYWMPGGNPHLRPERGWSRDAGIGVRLPHLTLDLTAFRVDTQDQIVWLPEFGDVWSPVNLARTRSTGIEAAVRYRRPIRSLVAGVDVDYTFTHGRDRSEEDGRLRYVPRTLLRGSATVAAGGLDAALSADLTGRRYITADASDWLDPFLNVSLRVGAGRDVGSGRLHAALIIDNLLDRDYAVVAGHPMPPRHARFAITIESISR